mgnify:CR=1 FL=1
MIRVLFIIASLGALIAASVLNAILLLGFTLKGLDTPWWNWDLGVFFSFVSPMIGAMIGGLVKEWE